MKTIGASEEIVGDISNVEAGDTIDDTTCSDKRREGLKCFICGMIIESLTILARQVHINRCLDSANDSPMLPARGSGRDRSVEAPQPPPPSVRRDSKKARASGAKSCKRSSGAKKALKVSSKVARRAPSIHKRSRAAAKKDPDLALALALSVSLEDPDALSTVELHAQIQAIQKKIGCLQERSALLYDILEKRRGEEEKRKEHIEKERSEILAARRVVDIDANAAMRKMFPVEITSVALEAVDEKEIPEKENGGNELDDDLGIVLTSSDDEGGVESTNPTDARGKSRRQSGVSLWTMSSAKPGEDMEGILLSQSKFLTTPMLTLARGYDDTANEEKEAGKSDRPGTLHGGARVQSVLGDSNASIVLSFEVEDGGDDDIVDLTNVSIDDRSVHKISNSKVNAENAVVESAQEDAKVVLASRDRRPEFQAMTISELGNRMKAYGLKQTSSKRAMIQKLTEIWDSLNCADTVEARSTISRLDREDDDGDDGDGGGGGGGGDDDDDRHAPVSSRSPGSAIAAPAAVSNDKKSLVLDFIRSQADVYDRVLSMETIDFKALRVQLASSGIRVGEAFLRGVLDEEGVSYSQPWRS
eukprot:g1822.t1